MVDPVFFGLAALAPPRRSDEQGLAKIQPYVERALKGELATYQDRIDYKYQVHQDVEVRC